jgi:hypothetical protein
MLIIAHYFSPKGPKTAIFLLQMVLFIDQNNLNYGYIIAANGVIYVTKQP